MSTLTAQSHSNNNVEVVYNPDTVKKGVNNGNPILRPDLKPLSFSASGSLVDYIGGADKVKKLLERYINQNAASASNESLDEKSGTINLDNWKTLISGASIAGETLDELRERLSDVQDEQSSLAERYVELDKGTPEWTEIRERMLALKEEKAGLAKSIADKEEIGRKRVAARQANKAAQEQGQQVATEAAVA